MSDDETRTFGRRIWEGINAPNLRENILPTRERAHLVLDKGADHKVSCVRLRKL
jgi:type I pantothenate kinase